MYDVDIKKKLSELLKDSMQDGELNEDGYFNDDACFSGNGGVYFKDLLAIYKNFGCVGITFEHDTIFIDINIARDLSSCGSYYFNSPDELSIKNGIIRLWYD